MIFSSFIFFCVTSRAELSPLWDSDVLETFNDVKTNPDFYTLDSEPIFESPDQMSQGISGLISDPGTDLWAEIGDECSLDSQLTNNIQKRNDVCTGSGSTNEPEKGLDLDQLEIPNPFEAGKGATQTITSDDTDICGIFNILEARHFAVCDSGNDYDRILNKYTGEYSLFNCERRKPRALVFCFESSRLTRHLKLTSGDSQLGQHHIV